KSPQVCLVFSEPCLVGCFYATASAVYPFGPLCTPKRACTRRHCGTHTSECICQLKHLSSLSALGRAGWQRHSRCTTKASRMWSSWTPLSRVRTRRVPW
ncbi:unnamed protein product, partial [Mycena citricolor]